MQPGFSRHTITASSQMSAVSYLMSGIWDNDELIGVSS